MPMLSDHTPQRIVSLQPSATVILQAIGQIDRLVACTKYCVEVCPEAGSGRTIVNDSWTANSEAIAAVRPDLVIAAVPYQEKSVAEILKAGTRFLGLAPKSLADIYVDVGAIAGITGVAERGEQVVRLMQSQIDLARSQTVGLERPRVFCEEWGKPLIRSQPWVAELVEAAGGAFVGEPGAQTSAEKMKADDPDILIAAWCGAGDRVPLQSMIRDRGWGELRAARAGRVFCIRDEFLNTPAPTLLQGLRALLGAIHPERFPRIDGLRCISDVSLESRARNQSVV
jgi:iron complex transport system substrate-binding protein